jgi:hypothetical protein
MPPKQQPPKAPAAKKYLEIKPEDQAKVDALKARQANKLKVEEEHLAIAEFGMMYGWDAVMAVLNNTIDGETFMWLLEAGRRIKNKALYDDSRAVLVGTSSANAKRPGTAFKKATKDLVKAMKADT